MATSTEPNPSTTSAARGSASTGSGLPPGFHSGKTFFWGIVLILVAGFLAWLFVGYFGTDRFENLDQKRVKEREAILLKRNTDDAHYLNDPPSYFDKEKGKIRVPMWEAMQLAVVDLQTNKPHAAYPLSQSPPQPAAAPTSPDKGAGSPQNGNINPPASNPTVGQPSPAQAAAQSPSPAPPGTSATPPPANSPGAGAMPPVGTAATGTPAPTAAPAATNNALNPGNAASGANPQPSPPARGNTETTGGPTPSGAQPQPLTNPAPPATPATAAPQDTPAPNPKTPGATPGGTPG